MLNNVPKPVIYGVTVVAVLLAVFVIFKTATGKGENGDRPSKDEIIAAQKAGAVNGGHAQGGKK